MLGVIISRYLLLWIDIIGIGIPGLPQSGESGEHYGGNSRGKFSG